MNVENTLKTALKEISDANNSKTLDEVRVRFLGKKGELTALLKSLGQMDASERPQAGEVINQAKIQIQEAIEEHKYKLDALNLSRELETSAVDITLPGRTKELEDCIQLPKF